MLNLIQHLRFFSSGLVVVLVNDVLSVDLGYPILPVLYPVIKFLKDYDLYNELDIYLESLFAIETEVYLETQIER